MKKKMKGKSVNLPCAISDYNLLFGGEVISYNVISKDQFKKTVSNFLRAYFVISFVPKHTVGIPNED